MVRPSCDAYEIDGPDRSGRWLIGCEHASNRVPVAVNGGTLGLSAQEMGRHIAYDLGAAGVARALGAALEAPTILGRFSRLVIDPNRGEDDPTLIMQVYDGTIVPGNRGLDAAGREHRLNLYYRPYHSTMAELAARGRDTVVVTVHSFTPRLFGRDPRPWHVGVLYDARDRRLADPLLRRLRDEDGLIVGENQPYAGHLPGDTIHRHALVPGRPNALIEIRHDLIATPQAQADWGRRLAAHLAGARADAGL